MEKAAVDKLRIPRRDGTEAEAVVMIPAIITTRLMVVWQRRKAASLVRGKMYSGVGFDTR